MADKKGNAGVTSTTSLIRKEQDLEGGMRI